MARLQLSAIFAVLACLLVPALAAAAPSPAPTPVNTSAPALTGTPVLGQTLTCSPGTWANSPSGYAYAWLRDGSPIAGQAASTYVVQTADQGHSLSCQVTATNAGGEYTIVGLPSGSYKVSFFPSEGTLNYLTQYYNGQTLESAANVVSVTAPNMTSGINAAMQAGGQIAGKVTDSASAAPLANIEVCASSSGAGNCATTNSAGEYTIVALPSGMYNVTFSPVLGIFGGPGGGNYLPAGQGSVVVNAPGVTAGIDAALNAGGQIAGTVTDASAKPLPFIVVCAVEPPETLLFGTCQLTNGAGEYTISGLPSGSYNIEFIPGLESLFGGVSGNNLPQFYEGKSSGAEAKSVTVTAPTEVSKIDAALQPGGQIGGTVTDASTHGRLANIEACTRVGLVPACGTTDTAGKYTISGLPSGEYKVEFISTGAGNYLTEAVNNVKVTAPILTPGVEAEMHAGGQISGKATDAVTNAALAGAEVCVTSLFVCVTTNAAGEYTISSLPSGTYSVEFTPPVGANYLSQSVTSVAVTAGAPASNASAALPHGGQISGRVTAAAGGATLAAITVCAFEPAGHGGGGCAKTTGPSGSASAASNALSVPVPNSTFTLAKKPVFDAKKGNLDFFFNVPNAGTFQWSLSFRNSDVGFADSLGISLGEGEAVAETARKKGKKGARCKAGFIKHKHKCVHMKVPFGSGSKAVSAGTVEIEVHASAKALKALEQGRTLHVSGPFTFQSALGGAPVSHTESAVVRMHKKKGKHRRK